MKKTQQSSLPEQTPEPQKLAAKIVHNGMYICLAAIPLSGLMIGLLFWLDLKDGILINIVIEAHEFAVSVIYWLIGIHIVAATYHRLKKDGVWSSMVPVWKEKQFYSIPIKFRVQFQLIRALGPETYTQL